jgi:hypothetical protein
MKVGNHANESWDRILARKRREYERTGRIFWGYGGAACHPISQVQPFAKLTIKEQGDIVLVMQPIDSNADQDEVTAKEYSIDGRNWIPIPPEHNVIGSKYALILDEIQEGDLDLNLNEYEVGIGPSTGRAAEKYFQGRTDKGCLVRSAVVRAMDSDAQKLQRKVQFMAKLKEPYGVLLR